MMVKASRDKMYIDYKLGAQLCYHYGEKKMLSAPLIKLYSGRLHSQESIPQTINCY